MPLNIAIQIQENMGYPELQKIDPNSDKKDTSSVSEVHDIGQAAIPSLLAGMFNPSCSYPDEN